MNASGSVERIRRGMQAQLAARRKRLDAGERHLGWKLGFGAPAAMAKLGISAPLSGFMTDRSLLSSGEPISLAGWKKPIAETEIAAHVGADIPAGASREAVARSIAALGPAIELVDLDQPPVDPEAILAGNIYHRRVILGPRARSDAKLDGLVGRLRRNGAQIAEVEDLEANTGAILDIVAKVADSLAAYGEGVRAGDIVICGAVIPPVEIQPDDREIAFNLALLDAVLKIA